MSEISMEERISIRESARALKKYGSTSNNVKRQDNFIKHEVLESDTLQGLALKYGVTTEQIRRANRLWANDSLFLRKSLLIPVPGDCGPSPAGDGSLLEDARHRTANNNNNNDDDDDHDHRGAADGDTSYNDFLVKIDCSIASTKTQVMMSQDNSQFVDNGSLFVRRKSAVSRLKQQRRQEAVAEAVAEEVGGGAVAVEAAAGSGGGGCGEVPLVVMTQGRRVRNSLQRLEREQDEMFQL